MTKCKIGDWEFDLEDISSYSPVVVDGCIVSYRVFSVRDQFGQQQMIELTREQGFELEAYFHARQRAFYPVEGGD